MRVRGTDIEVVRGSVVDQDVEVIVNAANTAMRGGGGVDGAIHRAAGPRLLAELKRVAPNGAETGTALVTPGFDLSQPWIIHTPGPIWNGGTEGEPELLSSCYATSLALAEDRKLRSIAFCSISTGIYGFPIELAAPIAVGVAIQHASRAPKTAAGTTSGEPGRSPRPAGSSIQRIVFAMYGAAEYEVFHRALLQCG